jgi:hypothetical protein
MQTATFKEWTLTKLDKAFGLEQIYEYDYPALQHWQEIALTIELTDFDHLLLNKLQKPLQRGGRGWNEVELENKFISPVFMAADFDDKMIGYFLERKLEGQVGNYFLSGIVDGMIAKGVREPDKPFFCMHEYKRSVDNDGQPDAQVLAAMLVVQADGGTKPVYGLYIVGLIWNFIVLHDKKYCISQNYDASAIEIFKLFKMLKALKHIIKTELM